MSVLGPFELSRGPAGQQGHPPDEESLHLRRKTRALLAYLADARAPVRREALAALLFPAADEPLGALRWQLSAVRRQVAPALIIADRETVRLDRSACRVDADAFERAFAAGGALSAAQAAAAVGLYRGEYLAGLSMPDAPEFEMWLIGRRAHYQGRYEQALADLVERMVREDRHDDALPWAQRLVQSNPLAEEPNLQLMRIYARCGRHDAALAHYEQYRRLLVAELRIDPGPPAAASQLRLLPPASVRDAQGRVQPRARGERDVAAA